MYFHPMKILITSDNHVGYAETDLLRGNDSFDTLKEILNIAREEHVDLVLQGGDLFHYNKPSRNTYNKTIKILKNYARNSPKGNLVFENIPATKILAIHGNHDDPSGFNSVSPIDILHSSSALHYFGKSRGCETITLEPICFNDSHTRVALYGLGYVKDAKLYSMLKANKVKYTNLDTANFNILILHQNKTFREKQYVPLDKIPKEFDLVIFGHEHLSEKTQTQHFDVIQVGSSVRTSLCLDERGDKFTYLVEIDEERSHRITRRKLQSVRPFYMETIAIQDENFASNLAKFVAAALENTTKETGNNMLPLLRLRIECSGRNKIERFELDKMVNGKIANPNDWLKISKTTRKAETSLEPKKAKIGTFDEMFRQLLSSMDLRVLAPSTVADALMKSVDKGIKTSFSDAIATNTENLIKHINLAEMGAEDLDDVIHRAVIKAKSSK